MAKIPSKVEARIRDSLKRYKAVIEQAKARDIGEADTSTLVKDILADTFGYDKYSEITAEYQIKSTYCDLALKLDGKLSLLIEVKAIGIDLKEAHIKQAVDYAANQGIEWVVLTNAVSWHVYRVTFGKPIGNELIVTIDYASIDPKNDSHLEALFLLTKEAQSKSLLHAYHEQRQALSKYFIGSLLLTEPVLSVIRRELRRISPDARIELSEIEAVIHEEVIKREVLEGEKAEAASRKINRAASRILRARSESASASPTDEMTSLPAPGGETPTQH